MHDRATSATAAAPAAAAAASGDCLIAIPPPRLVPSTTFPCDDDDDDTTMVYEEEQAVAALIAERNKVRHRDYFLKFSSIQGFCSLASGRSTSKNDSSIATTQQQQLKIPQGKGAILNEDRSSDDGLCYYTMSVQEARRKEDFVEHIVAACSDAAFSKFTTAWGLVDATFVTAASYGASNQISSTNTSTTGTTALKDRFCAAIQALPNDSSATLSLVFHGTSEANISQILEHGLDPKKRTGQAYGPGEYFSTDPGTCHSYCRGGHEILAFLVVVPEVNMSNDSNSTSVNVPMGYVVVPTSDHQLPLGVVRFGAASQKAMARSRQARAHLSKLSAQLQTTRRLANMTKLKAEIIQSLIQNHRLDVPSELYNKSKNALCQASKREISMYAHQLFDADFVAFYFEDLPPPMTAQEHQASGLKSVEGLEKDVVQAKKDLAKERANPKATPAIFGGMRPNAHDDKGVAAGVPSFGRASLSSSSPLQQHDQRVAASFAATAAAATTNNEALMVSLKQHREYVNLAEAAADARDEARHASRKRWLLQRNSKEVTKKSAVAPAAAAAVASSLSSSAESLVDVAGRPAPVAAGALTSSASACDATAHTGSHGAQSAAFDAA